ncbi:unnamed protein product [Chondrus crispus]|uniref:Reverse transcriptase Ty1/copia-type domain-containing protein n=1 Tax=Chondrus crispus TaxID=2769 RepID=R7QLP6_CHOCR|nr:unnamed protein product [Chondrus crispus]CDF38989.1 unnamed protein product [Chondrus crispus]|eukprot:XP_005718894.1 unnamed protein product [Chondrus crispus]
MLQRLAQYLHATRTEGILMLRGTKQGITIDAFSDADYANDETTRKPVTGSITLLNGSPVQWLSRQQPIVTKSTCEAEYIAAAETATLTIWLANMMKETSIPTRQPVLHVDNTAAVQMAKNTGATRRRKCIDVRYHFLHETVQTGKLKVSRISTTEQKADILTKPLKNTLFQKHKHSIQINPPPAPPGSPRVRGSVVPSRTANDAQTS